MVGILLLIAGIGILAGCGDSTESPPQVTVKTTITDTEAYRKATRSVESETLKNFPDTGLVDQSGDPVSFEQLLGNPVVLSSVYTRCPQAQMCPLQTRKMVQLQNELKKDQTEKVEFVLVSFDPAHDTPAVLRQYGQRYDLDYSNFSLWTGDTTVVQNLMKRIKVVATRPDPENPDTIVHNLRLLLINQNGVVQRVFKRSDWTTQEVKEVIQKMTE